MSSSDEIILQILLKMLDKDPKNTNKAFTEHGEVSPQKVAEAFVTIKKTIRTGLQDAIQPK